MSFFDKARSSFDSQVYAAEAAYVMGGGHRAGLPWDGDWHGHRRWIDFFDQIVAASTCPASAVPNMSKTATRSSYARSFITRSRAHGTQVTHPMLQIITVRNGLITDLRPFYWNVPDYVKAANR